MHTRILSTFLPVLLVPTLAVPAQPPSNWSTTALPANRTSAPNSLGTTVSFLTSNSVWLYSGVTKAWTVLPVTNPTPIFQANDYCIVQDGTKIHGFAAHTGKVETITTSGSATVVSGPSSSSWVTLVADGTQAWAFGAFHGKFEPLTLSQPAPTMVSNRLIGLLRDGSTVYGVSAHHGTFVPVAADTAAVLTIVGEGEVATAHSPGAFRAFSAQQNTWGTQVVPTPVSLLQQNEFAMAWSGTKVWAFSGLSGVLDSYTASAPITGVTGAEGVAAFVDGVNAVCYGAGRGRFVTKPAAAPTFLFDYHFAFVVEAGLVTPFSVLTGAFGAPLAGTFTISSNDAIGWLDNGSSAYAYSPVLNTFVPAPSVTPSSVVLVRDAVVLVHATGSVALSARHGTWVPLVTGQLNGYQAPNTGSTFLAIDGALSQKAHVFDARLNRWATLVATATLTSIKISRHTAMAHDGTFAYGFGQPSGEWYSVPLTSLPTTFDTASSIGSVIHGGQISVYSVQGSLSYTGRYPEFTQAINLGNALTLHQVGPVGSALVLGVGLAPAHLDLGPSFGVLYVDPNGLVTLPLSQVIGPDGIVDIVFPVPNLPGLVGAQLHFQDVVFPPASSPWLSSSVAPVFF